MALDFTQLEKDKAEELAQEVKDAVDMLVNEYGIKATKPLEDVRSMPSWIKLKNQGSTTILLAMSMYLDGVVTTLRREKKDC